jgi:hypothetical protein
MLDHSILLDDLLANYTPAHPQPWSWDDEEAEILARECICCGEPGHYQRQMEAHIAEHGLPWGVVLNDGKVGDGHHRVIAARRLSITVIPIASGAAAHEMWLQDHGPVDWHDRKFGDRSPWEHEWREKWRPGA